jgi:hypothetical protein
VFFADEMASENNPDQMGVELGKVLAKAILAQLSKPEDVAGHDSSVRIVSHLHPLPDTEVSPNRRPVSFTTTRNTGRSEHKRTVANNEVCRTVTPLKLPPDTRTKDSFRKISVSYIVRNFV